MWKNNIMTFLNRTHFNRNVYCVTKTKKEIFLNLLLYKNKFNFNITK